MNPVRFRPGPVPEGDPHPGSPVEWEDNWLSNALAWASTTFTPKWCQSEDHWTARTAQYLFTDCPCCLLFRGLVLGFLLANLVSVALAIALIVVLLN
jgi:hypothetical protein